MTNTQIKFCEVCGTSLQGRRADATVCSDTCRATRNQRKSQQVTPQQNNFAPPRSAPPPPIEVQAEECYDLPATTRYEADFSPLAQSILKELEENKNQIAQIQKYVNSYTITFEETIKAQNSLKEQLLSAKKHHKKLEQKAKALDLLGKENLSAFITISNDEFFDCKKRGFNSYLDENEQKITYLQGRIQTLSKELEALREGRKEYKEVLKMLFIQQKHLLSHKYKPLRRQDFLPQSKVPANIPRPQVVPIHQDEPTTPSTTPTPDAHTYTGKQVRNMALSPILHLPYDMNKYLGEIERDMCLIGLQGDAGAGKSTFAFFLAYLFDKIGLKVKYFSFEMGISNQVKNYIKRFKLSDKFAITDVGNYTDVELAASQFDVVVLDSFGKLFEGNTIGKVDDLRRRFPNTIFVGIFQKNAEGGTRGGSSSVYDSTAMWNIALKNKGLSNETRLFEVVKSRYGSKNFCLDDLLTKFV